MHIRLRSLRWNQIFLWYQNYLFRIRSTYLFRKKTLQISWWRFIFWIRKTWFNCNGWYVGHRFTWWTRWWYVNFALNSMFKLFWNRIRFYFTLRSINAQLKELKELRSKLVYKPRLEDIPEILERIERITSRRKALKKKKQKLLKKSLEFSFWCIIFDYRLLQHIPTMQTRRCPGVENNCSHWHQNYRSLASPAIWLCMWEVLWQSQENLGTPGQNPWSNLGLLFLWPVHFLTLFTFSWTRRKNEQNPDKPIRNYFC